MTTEDFRRIALGLPEAVEQGHMGHPDFRVAGKVFATLGYPDAAWGMIKLAREQQEVMVAAEPEVFRPVKGGWGAKGATNVRLEAADEATLVSALTAAWLNTAPPALVKAFKVPST